MSNLITIHGYTCIKEAEWGQGITQADVRLYEATGADVLREAGILDAHQHAVGWAAPACAHGGAHKYGDGLRAALNDLQKI